jgi:hypothetical protein
MVSYVVLSHRTFKIKLSRIFFKSQLDFETGLPADLVNMERKLKFVKFLLKKVVTLRGEGFDLGDGVAASIKGIHMVKLLDGEIILALSVGGGAEALVDLGVWEGVVPVSVCCSSQGNPLSS